MVGEIPITEVRVTGLQNAGNLVAVASVTFAGALVVTGVKMVNGRNGVFVSMPSRKDNDGNYHDTVFPLSKEGRDAILGAVRAQMEAEGIPPF